jgi:hypothetical protein
MPLPPPCWWRYRQPMQAPALKPSRTSNRKVDSAIEIDAVSGGWKPEILYALRVYQPTPGTLAASEGRGGRRFEDALDRLERARYADRAMDVARCYQEIDRARTALGE